MDIAPLLVESGLSLIDAYRRLEQTGLGILLMRDADGRLSRTVTDGDLRRAILAGAELGADLASLPRVVPTTVSAEVTAEAAMALMNAKLIDHLPVVGDGGQPIDLLLRRDLDTRILLSSPHMSRLELDYVTEAFDTNWIAPLGPNVDAFERELADHVGIGHAAALASGTAAIHLALNLLGVGPGDTVFCSTLTFVASANPILYQGAQPVFIDSEPATWNMSHQALERALAEAERHGGLPKAVVVVNLYGQSADMAPILALCDRYGVALVEDAAESLGATYRGRHSGTFGKLGIYSFNGNKIITTSGGGMLVSDDAALIEKARFLATQARDPAPWYRHSEVGYNYRMSNVLAGIGRGQLKVLEERVAARREIFRRYREALAQVPGLDWMPEAPYGRSTRWLSVCRLVPDAAKLSPAQLIAVLAAHNIEARHVWNPMHRQPLFSHRPYYPHSESESFSDQAFAQGVCLPSGSNLDSGQIDRICAVVETAMN